MDCNKYYTNLEDNQVLTVIHNNDEKESLNLKDIALKLHLQLNYARWKTFYYLVDDSTKFTSEEKIDLRNQIQMTQKYCEPCHIYSFDKGKPKVRKLEPPKSMRF